MKYRPEIDGLRALAVVPVVLFHAGFEYFQGGFVGVDVFFVISGYLITTIIINDLENDNFSLVGFYERRARRILPALFVVVAATVPFAWMWMYPVAFKDFAQSVSAVAVFSSNFLFWKETGYFNTVSELKPLLHTWSLAVEEQYYIIFPVIMMLFWRRGVRFILVLLVSISIVSLAAGHYLSVTNPSAAFFLLPTRAWELLIGACAAIYLQKHAQPDSQMRRGVEQVLSLSGLLLIAFAVYSFDKETPVPGLPALAPTIGTVLIVLFATPRTIVHRMLSTRILVGIGLISYSAYLWHQPLFALARHRSLTHPSLAVMLVLCIVTFVLAYLSWRFVEGPFRKKGTFSRKVIFSTAAFVSVIAISFGVVGHKLHGIPDRFSPSVLAYFQEVDAKSPLSGNCQYGHADDMPRRPVDGCMMGPRDKELKIAVLGDSHADAMAWPVMKQLAERGVPSVQLAVSGCQPSHGYKLKVRDCGAVVDVLEDYLQNSSIDTLVISARWTQVFYDHGYDNGEGGVEAQKAATVTFVPGFDVAENGERATRGQSAIMVWRKGIEHLSERGMKIVLVYPVPEAGWDVPVYLAKKTLYEADPRVLSTSYARFLTRNQPIMDGLDTIEVPNLVRVEPHRRLCDTFVKGRCINAIDGRVFYYDDDHLSIQGAALIAPDILKALETLGSIEARPLVSAEGARRP